MLHKRQELHVGEAAARNVLNKWSRNLAVPEETTGVGEVAAPTAQVHLVHRDRRVERDAMTTLVHPLVIVPLVVEIPDDRARPRGFFTTQSEGVSLFEGRAVSGGDDILIDVAELGLGHHRLPDTR